jgi:MYXO-CTERM domain-containing protein
LTGGSTIAGTDSTPANTLVPDYSPGVGAGGSGSSSGGNGEIVISYATPEPGAPALFAATSLGGIGLLARRRRRD